MAYYISTLALLGAGCVAGERGAVATHDENGSYSRERVTKKPFGIYITPEISPVQPERFSGYHTGVDYEIFSDEQDVDVPVYAICGGEIVAKRAVRGYGGVVIQSCKLDGQELRVLYGHVSLPSIPWSTGDFAAPGAQIAVLGQPPDETGGERKHLHLGVHKGAAVDLRGYVGAREELEQWVDVPVFFLGNMKRSAPWGAPFLP